MRSSFRFSSSSRSLWRRAGYGLLLVAFSWSVIFSASFTQIAYAASFANIQSQPQPEKGDKQKTSAAATSEPTSTPKPNIAATPYGTPVTFTNSSVITISDNTQAAPYPSTINVSGVPTNVLGVTVSFYALSHGSLSDVDILLVAPGGQNTLVLSDKGSKVTNLNLTFDDTATSSFEDAPYVSGTYLPSNGDTTSDGFVSPAPAGPYPVSMSVFSYANPNGTWQLFVRDDESGGSGMIAGGWALTFYTSDQPSIAASGGNKQSATVTNTFATQLQATVRNGSALPVSGVVVTFTAPASGASGTFAGGAKTYTGTTDAQGIVTATTFTANTIAGSYNVTATATGAPNPALFKLTNTPGAATSIAVNSGSGQATGISGTFTQPLSTIVYDAYNNPVSNAIVSFSAPTSGPSGLFYPGVSTTGGISNLSGIARAANFTANSLTGSYQVTATLLSGSATAVFTLTNLPVTLTKTGGDEQAMVTNNIFSQSFSVRVLDSNNNAVKAVPVTFSAPASGASGTFANGQVNYTATTDSAGVAKSTAFTANGTLGAYQVIAKLSDNTQVSFSLTNVSPGTVALESNNYTVSEGVGSAVITLTRSGTSAGVVVANLKINNFTTSDADYNGINNSSQLDTSFNPGTGTPGETYKVEALPNGKILLGGNFATYNGQTVGRIARLNADGSLDTTFLSTGAGTNTTVHNFVVQPDGKIIIVGGDFSSYNGTPRNRIARLNADGSLDTSFAATGAGANAAILRVALQPDGKVLVGGNFTTYDGVIRNRVARLNTDGTLDTTFGANLTGANGTVWAFALQADGKIIIGGSFTEYNSTPANRIARLNADGTLDTTFNSSVGFNATVWSVVVPNAASGKILVGGEFTLHNDQNANYIVRLNGTDGSRDTSFDALNSGANESIRTMTLQPDGKVLLGGTFSLLNNVLANRIGRLNTDGSLDLTLLSATSNGGPNNLIWAIAAQADGKILVGGDLTTYDGQSRNHIARAGGYSVAWASGDSTPKIFTLPIVDDNLTESDEQVVITIDSVRSSATVGSTASTTVTILDNEGSTLTIVSGSGQTAAAGTSFGQPLVVNLVNASLVPIAGQIVTFTAPTTGASALFANGSNVYTVTTNANGIATSSLFTANIQAGTYTVTATSGGVATPVSFVLTNTCSAVVVTSLSDNGKGTLCGTLSYALLNSSAGVTITFNLGQGSTITFTDSLTVSLKAGVGINGGANGIVINGGGVSGDGLVLGGGNVLTNLTVRNFGGREIVAPASAPGNKFYRVKLES